MLGPKKIALLFPLLALTACLPGCFSQESQVLNKPVLIVNQREISTQEFSERLAIKLKHYDALYAKDEAVLSRAKEETAQTFVLEILTQDFAKKNGLRVEAAEIEAKVSEIRSRYPDDFAFRRSLAQENLSLEAWRDSLEISLLQKKVSEKISADLPAPTEAELKAFYEANKAEFQQPARIRLRQIVLAKEDDAKHIADELAKGADLAKLSKQFSVAPEGANGGDTGWIDQGTLEVFDQAFKMPMGPISKILKSPYGYHIYQVLKKEPERRLSFEDAKAKIRARLIEAKAQKAFTTWLEVQTKKASVRRDDALLSAIKVTTRGS